RPVLELLPEAKQRKMRTVLGFNPETAGGLMSTEFVTVPDDASVANALARIRALLEAPENLTDLFVVSGDRLAGPVSRVRRRRRAVGRRGTPRPYIPRASCTHLTSSRRIATTR